MTRTALPRRVETTKLIDTPWAKFPVGTQFDVIAWGDRKGLGGPRLIVCPVGTEFTARDRQTGRVPGQRAVLLAEVREVQP